MAPAASEDKSEPDTSLQAQPPANPSPSNPKNGTAGSASPTSSEPEKENPAIEGNILPSRKVYTLPD